MLIEEVRIGEWVGFTLGKYAGFVGKVVSGGRYPRHNEARVYIGTLDLTVTEGAWKLEPYRFPLSSREVESLSSNG